MEEKRRHASLGCLPEGGRAVRKKNNIKAIDRHFACARGISRFPFCSCEGNKKDKNPFRCRDAGGGASLLLVGDDGKCDGGVGVDVFAVDERGR